MSDIEKKGIRQEIENGLRNRLKRPQINTKEIAEKLLAMLVDKTKTEISLLFKNEESVELKIDKNTSIMPWNKDYLLALFFNIVDTKTRLGQEFSGVENLR